MAIIGNSVLLSSGNGVSKTVGFVRHAFSSTSSIVAGGSSSSYVVSAVKEPFFTYSGGVFTCGRAGTYQVRLFAIAAYGSSGGQKRVTWSLRQNGTSVASATGVTYQGRAPTVTTVTLAVGDTLAMYSNMQETNGVGSCGMEIEIT